MPKDFAVFNAMDQRPGYILIGMLPIWLVTTLPTWLVIFIFLYALAALYVAIKFREVRKFLAGAFFVSSGILWYLWLTGTSIPLVMPYVGTVSIETPDISGQRAIVHFILFLLCFYFGSISNMNSLYKQLVRSSVLGTLALLALIFIPAGTFQYWKGWAYVAVFIICSGAYTVYLAKHDPALLKRRTEAGISHEKEFTQKVVMALLFAVCIVLVVLPPLDVRFGWSLMPWQVSIIGDTLVAFSFYIFYLVSKVNTYAAANVRVEEGQKVISTGVYGFVRHPMYFAALFLPLARHLRWIVVDIAFVSCVYTHSRCTYPERRKSTCAGLARLRRIHAQRPIPIDFKCLVNVDFHPLAKNSVIKE